MFKTSVARPSLTRYLAALAGGACPAAEEAPHSRCDGEHASAAGERRYDAFWRYIGCGRHF